MDPKPPSMAATILKALFAVAVEAHGGTPAAFAADAGVFIGNILRPIVKEEIAEAMKALKDSAVVGKPNADLQDDWNRGPLTDVRGSSGA